MLDPNEIPRNDGAPVGRYRLRYSSLNERLPGVHFVDGVAAPVEGLPVVRMHAAFGEKLAIEPYDADTAAQVLEGLRYRSQHERAQRLEGEFARLFGETRQRAHSEPEPGPEPQAKPQPAELEPEPESPDSEGTAPAPPTDDELADLHMLTVGRLREIAAHVGASVDRRWGERRLRSAIRKALNARTEAPQ